jgi:hypothetical protein
MRVTDRQLKSHEGLICRAFLRRERQGSPPDFAPHRSDGIEVWRVPPWVKGS